MSEFGKGDIVVVGAGLVGSLLAYLLQNKGYNVSVFERYGDIRQIPSLGRSINLVLTNRGLRAADAIGGGLREELINMSVGVTGRVIHMEDGSEQFQRYGKDDSEKNFSISRYDLNKFLIEKAERAGAKMYFGHALDSANCEFNDNDVNNGGDVGSVLAFDVTSSDGLETKSRAFVKCACPILACDGGGSRVRAAMKEQGYTDSSEKLLGAEKGHVHAYKEILFPVGSGLIPEGLHIWPRRNHMLMALANLDGSMTGTLYADADGSDTSFAELQSPEKVQAFFEKYYADALPMIGGAERAIDQMLTNPNGLLGTVRTVTWNVKGRVLLLGDAAHAIVPFFGQGMNCGFEDVYEIYRLLAANAQLCTGGRLGNMASTREEALCSVVGAGPSAEQGATWAKIFNEFFISRKPNADAIANMALENFDEMSDHVGDLTFLLRKKIENRIEKEYPLKFRSGYSMVCYGGGPGNVSYSNAFALKEVQNAMLDEVVAKMTIPEGADEATLSALAETVSLSEMEKLIDERLGPMHSEMKTDLSTVRHGV